MMNLVESNQKAEKNTKLADFTLEEETNIRKNAESDMLYKCNPVLSGERGYHFGVISVFSYRRKKLEINRK